MTAQSKPVLRAEHMKRIKAARAKLDKARAQQATALEEFYGTIRAAYDDGIQGAPIREAAGISADRAHQIKNQRR